MVTHVEAEPIDTSGVYPTWAVYILDRGALVAMDLLVHHSPTEARSAVSADLDRTITWTATPSGVLLGSVAAVVRRRPA